MVEKEEPKEPTKRKDQIKHDGELAQRLQAQLQAKIEEEDRLARQREEEDNIVSWDNAQAMMEADNQMAERLQAEKQASLTDEEKARLFVQLLDVRKKHFAALRAQEIMYWFVWFVMLLSGLCVITTCTLHLQLAYAHYICSLHLQASICTLHLQIAYAHCICTLHLQLAFASKHLHIAFADCICTLHLYIAFAACICKQAFAHCICRLHM
ncbi:hypothetical protein Tco_0389153, partial [Tanacetum coccineum]